MIRPALVPVLVLAVVFVISGVAKLRAPQTVEASFRDLRVAPALDRPWIRAAFPWGEIGLAVLLLVAPGPLAPVAAVLALALCCAYWFLVRHALGFEEPVSCGCFGEASSEPVSARTLWRNTVLVLLALLWLVASFLASAPHLVGSLRAEGWLWVLGAALAVLITYLSVGRGGPAEEDAPDATVEAPVPERDEEGDYVRRPIPGMVVRQSDGEWITLTGLASTQAVLLVMVSPGCGPCTKVLNQAADWRERLGPAVRLVFLTVQTEEGVRALVPEEFWDGMLYDVEAFGGRLLGLNGTPSAVLLGADGYLAGGPVHGFGQVEQFVQDIQDELTEAGRA